MAIVSDLSDNEFTSLEVTQGSKMKYMYVLFIHLMI